MNHILYWNSILLECSRRDFTRGFNNAQQPGPIATSRAMAMAHIAMHDAVAFRNNPNAAYLNKIGAAHSVAAHSNQNVDAIIAGAAVTILKNMYPRYVGYIDDSVGKITNGFDYGATIAEALLEHRENDGSDAPISSSIPSPLGYGDHRADPFQPNQTRLGADWGDVRRFTTDDGVNVNLDPYPGYNTPDFLSNADYQADFVEARDLGAAGRGARTADQERIGVYWGYDGAMNLGVPPRLYNQVARKIVLDHNLNTPKTAELFAMINVAMADAGIDAWHWKYTYNLWRPVAGIRETKAPDGDPFWAPLGAPQTNVNGRRTLTPNFPAYPSGHATFGAALFQVLRLGLDTATGPITLADVLAFDSPNPPNVPGEEFNFVSDELDGIATDPDGSTRTRVDQAFKSYAHAVWENSVSRIYLGVHWRFDGIPRDAAHQEVGGVPLGLEIGKRAFALFNDGPSLGGTL
jgi:Vanadium chloroperoxidase N-terminal domain/PAP2 superfamily